MRVEYNLETGANALVQWDCHSTDFVVYIFFCSLIRFEFICVWHIIWTLYHHQIYRYSHQMQFSECMKQLKLFRVHSAFNVSWDFLEYAHYCLNDVRKPCIDISNIEVSSSKILTHVVKKLKGFKCLKWAFKIHWEII